MKLPTHHNFKNRTGQKIGHLTAIAYAGRTKSDIAKWLCRCDCGKEKIFTNDRLISSVTKSCGCLAKERFKEGGKKNLTHGETGINRTTEYSTWKGMKNRCLNPNTINFKWYGGSGVTVCERWLQYENFISDMGRKPSPKHTLERRKNSEGYSPENCYWATRSEQARNKTNNRMITYEGVTKNLTDWASSSGLRFLTIHHRLARGWDFGRAITQPCP